MRGVFGHPWVLPAAFLASALVFAVWGLVRQEVTLLASAVIMVLLTLPYLRAVRVRSRPFAQAQGTVDAGGVAVFWRPGCQYCMTLLKTLTPEERGRVHWVNIWQEPEAAAFLETLHARRDGHPHQAVPTAWSRGEDWVVACKVDRSRLRERLRGTAVADG